MAQVVGVNETQEWTQFISVVNPVHEELQIQFDLPDGLNKVYYELVDLYGRSLISGDLASRKGRKQIDLSAFASGIYLVHFHSPKSPQGLSIKILKL